MTNLQLVQTSTSVQHVRLADRNPTENLTRGLSQLTSCGFTAKRKHDAWIVSLCDENQPVDWLALDALAQAEHDPMACSIIISHSQDWLNQMTHYMNQSEDTQQLVKNKQVELLYANTTDELLSFANQYAPEHLMLCHQSISSESLTNYGSLFLGANSAVALGDYISGPNHTLPTLGYAKQQGGLSVATFQKIISTQDISKNGAQHLAQSAIPIAQSEGLKYHSQSLKVRLN